MILEKVLNHCETVLEAFKGSDNKECITEMENLISLLKELKTYRENDPNFKLKEIKESENSQETD